MRLKSNTLELFHPHKIKHLFSSFFPQIVTASYEFSFVLISYFLSNATTYCKKQWSRLDSAAWDIWVSGWTVTTCSTSLWCCNEQEWTVNPSASYHSRGEAPDPHCPSQTLTDIALPHVAPGVAEVSDRPFPILSGVFLLMPRENGRRCRWGGRDPVPAYGKRCCLAMSEHNLSTVNSNCSHLFNLNRSWTFTV